MQARRSARARYDDEHRLARLDERDRAVLQLTRREALGVDVGELLELQRALQRDGIADVAAEEEHRPGVGHPVRELLDALGLVEHGLQLSAPPAVRRCAASSLLERARSARDAARRGRAAIRATNAFVDATATSGPACVYTTASDSRGIVAPCVLQIEIVRAPISRAYFTAMRVSMVCPTG